MEKIYENYALLIVKVGVNVQKGQDVIINASTRISEFVEYVVKAAYKAGAKRVSVEWKNDAITRLDRLYQSEEELGIVLPWEEAKAKYDAHNLPCMIHIVDSDPNAFDGIDHEKIGNARIKRYQVLKPYLDQRDGKYQWTIVALPSVAWANKIFPNDPNAYEKLWQAIIDCTRLEGDVLLNWQQHMGYLKEKSDKMNAYHFTSLHYTNSLGTDLYIGLNPDYKWLNAHETSLLGHQFMANMPSEEVFALPKKYATHGKVVATMPLSYQGTLIEDFSIEFEKGKVVKVRASKGQDVLEKLISMDQGSAYLGEVALVSYDSPIRQSGILFYNTLFDENASCHIALGDGIKEGIEGFEKMNDEQLEKIECNRSMNHVDFMIGGPDLLIEGTTIEGDKITVFKDGHWAI